MPSSKPAEAVIILNTEPGSYVEATTLFLFISYKLFVFSSLDKESHVAESFSFGVKGVFKL